MDMNICKKRHSISVLVLMLIAANAVLTGCKERFIPVEGSVDDPFDKPVAVYYDESIRQKAQEQETQEKLFDYRQI